MRKIQPPIHNKQLIRSIGKELNNMNEQYYLIFQLLLETGMTLENIPQMKVSDLKSNPITFTPIHKHVTRQEFISGSLSDSLMLYAKNKDDNALAFHSLRDEYKPFPIRNFQKALLRASSLLSLDQPITTLAIRKTYLLNLFLKTHDYQKIRALTNCVSNKGVLEYLNLDPPEVETKKLSSYTIKEALLNQALVEKVSEHSFKVLVGISENIKENDINLPSDYFSEVLKLTTDIEAALSRFEDVTSNPDILKAIYSQQTLTENPAQPE